MSRQRHHRSRFARRRRRAALSLLAAAAVVAAGVLIAPARPAAPTEQEAAAPQTARSRSSPLLRLTAAGQTVATVSLARYLRAGVPEAARLRRAVADALPARTTADRDRATIVYANDRSATAAQAVRAARGASAVVIVREPVSSRIGAPIIAQRMRNNCETAALSILLRSLNVTVSQEQLQKQLPRSGPTDPQGVGANTVWGDPDRGFVGRADGGGPAGGFGVYPGPIAALARRYGVELTDLSGESAARVYARLLHGRAVMAWVGLAAGPYGTWTSPAGRRIEVNFNEHTVVLRGINTDGSVEVSNPLKGTAETWSRSKFEAMWDLLGRRALAT